MASSADGKKLIAAANRFSAFSPSNTASGPIYISTNSGINWTVTSAPYTNWNRVVSSADGNKLIASSSYSAAGFIYISTNSGDSWALTDMPQNDLGSVASSADGNKLVAGIGIGNLPANGGIWISQFMPSPQLNIAPSNTNLDLSWIIPSTNFVLQQSSDLASWQIVTNQPALNLTNLQNEVFLSPTNDNAFFRLISQ